MKILITNTVVLNGGDAAILHAILHILKKVFGVNTEFIVYDNQPDIANKYYPQLEFRKLIYFNIISSFSHFKLKRYSRWLKLSLFYFAVWCWHNHLRIFTKLIVTKQQMQEIALYDSADLIVSTGGTYLVENYDLTPRIFGYKVGLLLGKPLVFFTQSLGPFFKKKNRIELRKIFNRALVIFLRDEVSVEHLKNLKIDMQKVYIYPDAVFVLANKEAHKNIIPKSLHKKQVIKVAISVRYWPFFKKVTNTIGMNRYKTAISDTVIYLVKEYNADITFISTCQGIQEYWSDDSEVALDIYNSLPTEVKKHVNLDRNFHSPIELIRLLRTFDITIATRMHMAILSLLAGTAVLPIAYEFKTKELFRQFEMNNWVQDIETINTDNLKTTVNAFIAELPNICRTLFDRVEKQKVLANSSGQKVKEAYEWIANPTIAF